MAKYRRIHFFISLFLGFSVSFVNAFVSSLHKPLLSKARPFKPNTLSVRMAEATVQRILVVGSVNVDLIKEVGDGTVAFEGSELSLAEIKSQTLPATSFVQIAGIRSQLQAAGLTPDANEEEAFAISLMQGGECEQVTGGKGANAAAAVGQTLSGTGGVSEFFGRFGSDSATENKMLMADLNKYGSVRIDRCQTIEGPTGTAFILKYSDNDNAIILIGGANQCWPTEEELSDRGGAGADLSSAVDGATALMLQREVPDHVNRIAARLAHAAGTAVIMDVGGSDAPLDEALLPYLSVVAPNESELEWISGVPTKGLDGKPTKEAVRAAVAQLKAKCAPDRPAGDELEVLVTLGADGAIYFEKGWQNCGVEVEGSLPHEYQMGSFNLGTSSGRPVDTTGAGDCFRGSFVAARYGDGKGIEESMRWAAAAGSLAVEVSGAMPSMPTRQQINVRVAQPLAGQEKKILLQI